MGCGLLLERSELLAESSSSWCADRGALSGSWWWAEVAPHRDISPDCLAAILNVAALAELTAIDRCSDRDRD